MQVKALCYSAFPIQTSRWLYLSMIFWIICLLLPLPYPWYGTLEAFKYFHSADASSWRLVLYELLVQVLCIKFWYCCSRKWWHWFPIALLFPVRGKMYALMLPIHLLICLFYLSPPPQWGWWWIHEFSISATKICRSPVVCSWGRCC